MTGAPTLADQRLALVARLHEQRQRIAGQLDAGDQGTFPRSMTLRLLISRPELAFRLVGLVVRSRLVGSSIAIALIVHLLRPRGVAGRLIPRRSAL